MSLYLASPSLETAVPYFLSAPDGPGPDPDDEVIEDEDDEDGTPFPGPEDDPDTGNMET